MHLVFLRGVVGATTCTAPSKPPSDEAVGRGGERQIILHLNRKTVIICPSVTACAVPPVVAAGSPPAILLAFDSLRSAVPSAEGGSPPKRKIRHPAFGIRHPAFGIRHPAFGIRHSVSGIRHSASGIRYPAFYRAAPPPPHTTLNNKKLKKHEKNY